MDRVSAIGTPTGWMPSVAPSAPAQDAVAPVLPVEAGSNSMDAGVDAQTPQGRTAAVRAFVRDQTAPQDPDAPCGPPPTFDMTPLEAQAARLAEAVTTGTAIDARASTAAPNSGGAITGATSGTARGTDPRGSDQQQTDASTTGGIVEAGTSHASDWPLGSSESAGQTLNMLR